MNKKSTIPKELKTNPVITALEEADEPAVELRGFTGASEDGIMHLYQTQDTSSYVDIPKDLIIYMDEWKDGEPGEIRVFVPASHRLLNVRKYWRPASEFTARTTSLDIGDLPPLRKRETFWSCAGKCEARFADEARQILIDEVRYLRETNPERRNLLLAQIGRRKHQAKSALLFCLTTCDDQYGAPGRWFVLDEATGEIHIEPFSIPAYNGYLVAKYLEKPE